MQNYWWVNHNKTAKQEIANGFLWSPMRNKNGANNEFYNNMRRAAPGELVASCSNGLIAYIGRVEDFAVPAIKPASYEKSGDNWSADGWLLKVRWEKLPSPCSPRQLLPKLATLLPPKYSPFNPKTGKSNEAYLAKVSKEVFDLLLEGGASTTVFQASTRIGINADTSGPSPALVLAETQMERRVLEDNDLSATQKQQVINARYGQGTFRDNVIARHGSCRLTGLTNPSLLIASHIKPWRVCTSVQERLSGANGLMLAPHVDKLFDRGFISFSDDGTVLRSPKISDSDLAALGLTDSFSKKVTPFDSEQASFLEYHRRCVFLDKI